MSDNTQPHVMPIITEVSAEQQSEMLRPGDKLNVGILPLRNMVLFPGMAIPVSLGRDRSMRVVNDAITSHCPIGVVCQRDSNVDDPGQEDLYDQGTLADIIKLLEMPDGTTSVILQGRLSFRLNNVTTRDPFMRADIVALVDVQVQPGNKQFDVLISTIREVANEMMANMGDRGRELAFSIRNIDNPTYLVNFLALNMPFETIDKQALLEDHSMEHRAYRLYSLLSRESKLLQLKADITSRTREDISQQQREHFLQQQIRTIQEELGNTADEDIDELEKRAKEKEWPEEMDAIFKRELLKLERLNQQSPDYSVQYGYLDTLLSLPWNHVSSDDIDLTCVENTLNKDHYGLDKVKDRIIEHLAVLKLRGDLKAPILCLYGPPGVGKTSLGRSVAEALNRKYARISLGGLHDEAEIRGHRRTYIGAMPGRIIDALKRAGTSNPVIVLDEIDKVGQDYKGDPANALLEVLDPEQNNHFHDNFIDVDYDLSKVLFIATANTLSTVSQPLLDRMEVIEITGYITEEKTEIARRHLIPKQLEQNGFNENEISFETSAIVAIVERYTRESGVRELEKKIGKVLRKLARHKADGTEFPTTITDNMLADYLGAPEYNPDRYEGNDFAGVVTGLAWTQVGGEILYVESSLAHGKGDKLTLTGNLGDVMKESAVIALQYLRAHAEQIGINAELFDKYNVHIHVPEGAIPKDGPSAGITMLTSLASSFTQRRVMANLAMTGEITLRGKVLPVGGIKEKILAAKRAGITHIMLCRENEKDIREINPMYVKGLEFHYVDTIKDVLELALLPELVPDANPSLAPKKF